MAKLLLAKKRPKLGIQLPNSGDDNQSCHILTVIFNPIKKLWILYYNLYISTLIYKNVMIATSLQWCDHGFCWGIPPDRCINQYICIE